MMLSLSLFHSTNPSPAPNQNLLPSFLPRPRNPTSLRNPRRKRSNSSLYHVSLPDPTDDDEGENVDEVLSPSSVAALAAAIRRASTASPVQFTQRVEKPGRSGLVLPSPDFHRICIEQLDLFRAAVHRDAMLSVFVRPAGSYVMDQLELRRVTFYPGIDMSENADSVILVGNFSLAAGLHAAETSLSKQQVEFVSEYGAVVLPMVKHPFVVGFLIAELPRLETEVCENAPNVEQHQPFYSKKDESPRLPPYVDKRMPEIQAVNEEPNKNYAHFSLEQKSIAIMISRSLAMAYVMDQAILGRFSSDFRPVLHLFVADLGGALVCEDCTRISKITYSSCRHVELEEPEAIHLFRALRRLPLLRSPVEIRQNDRLAVSKLVTSLTRGTVRSPLAQCLLIRYATQVIRESSMNTQTGDRPFFDFLEACLRHKTDMVILEAARAITELNGVTSRELIPAITILQLFLSSSKPVLRFAAVRTLNKVAMTHPLAVTNCNVDMESLISDQNRSIATLAITTLLKTGNESSVDRLMKQITNFMSDIADEFKIVVVEAIRSLCLKFPLKYRSMMNFLSNILREEGGFEYKKAIVDSIVILIREIPDAKESGLFHLCEFIEDCEFTYLSTQILHFLGNEGPKTSDPSKYIRYIYNRVILENSTIRASAVSTLAKFGALVDPLKPRIFVLLRRCLFDIDDEVRDRATLYLSTLGGDGSVTETVKDVKEFLFGPLDVPLVNLEKSLRNYEASEEPFDICAVPREVKSQPLAEKKAVGKKSSGFGAPPTVPTAAVDAYEKWLSSIPEFSSFGKLFKSSSPVELTEAETEYAVNVIKHVYDEHVVFQYNCTNTIPEQLLENVTIFIDASDAEEFSEVASKPLRTLPYDSPGQTFVAFEKPAGVSTVGKFSNMLKFIVREVDPSTGEAEDEGVEDEYQLEDFEVMASDYMLKVGVSNFKNAWDNMNPEGECVDEYGLGTRESLAEAVNAVVNILGMQPCEGTEVVPSNARSHTCLLSGVFIGNVKVLVRLSFGIDGPKQVAMKLAVRSDDPAVSEAIHEIVNG